MITRTTEAFAALDRGEFAAAIALDESGAGLWGGPEEALWRAEVAAYRYRLDEAVELLASVSRWPSDLALRVAVVETEVGMLAGRFDEAGARFGELEERARLEGEPWMVLRTRLDRARAARMLSRLEEAVRFARSARELAGLLGAKYSEGVAAFNESAALRELGRGDEALVAINDALNLLQETERLRVWALALNAHALLDAGAGRFGDAAVAFDCAEEALLGAGSVGDLHVVAVNRGWTLYAQGRYSDAAKTAEGLLVEDRSRGDHRAELFDLRLLTSTRLALGDIAGGQLAGREMLRLAETVGSDVDVLEARLCEIRARATGGERECIGELESLISEIELTSNGPFIDTARVLRADSLRHLDPVTGWRAFRELSFPSPHLGLWCRAELALVERAWRKRGLRVENGYLQVSLVDPLPERQLAQAILDYEIMRAALEAAGGNAAAAGRLVGEKYWNAARLAREAVGDSPTRRPKRRFGRRGGSRSGRNRK